MKAGSPREGRDVTRGLLGRRRPALTVERNYEGPSPGKALPGHTLKEVPRNLTETHAFVAKQAMFALLMLSSKLNITDKNFEPNWENFQRCPGDGVENDRPLGAT